MRRYSIVILILLGSCGKIHFEPKDELINPQSQQFTFWAKSEACNLDSLLNLSKEQNKPVLLYFTGFGCVNNRKMEDFIFVHKDVYDLMHEKFIPWALYVDDKTKLNNPHIDRFTGEEEITMVGSDNLDIQQSLFRKNLQPYFVVLRSDKSLVADFTYTTSKTEFKEFLLNALKNF